MEIKLCHWSSFLFRVSASKHFFRVYIYPTPNHPTPYKHTVQDAKLARNPFVFVLFYRRLRFTFIWLFSVCPPTLPSPPPPPCYDKASQTFHLTNSFIVAFASAFNSPLLVFVSYAINSILEILYCTIHVLTSEIVARFDIFFNSFYLLLINGWYCLAASALYKITITFTMLKCWLLSLSPLARFSVRV